MGGSKRPGGQEQKYGFPHGGRWRAAASECQMGRCATLCVETARRVGKRRPHAKTLMTCEAPSSNPLARRFSRPPSRPYGCPSLSSEGIGLISLFFFLSAYPPMAA